MKALSILQPWASLIVHGFKRIETRSWMTLHRGFLAIHAAAWFRKAQRERYRQHPFRDCLAAAGIHRMADFPLSSIVGVVNVIDCVPAGELLDEIDDRERHFGDFGPGMYAWLLADPRPLIEPIPCIGKPSFFGLPAEIATELVRGPASVARGQAREAGICP
jgi:activating signal cointegrator 1